MKILNILCSLVLMFSLAALGTYNYHRYTTMSDEGPVIMMDSDTIEVSVKDDPSVLLEGVMAYDKEDGDVTSIMWLLMKTPTSRKHRENLFTQIIQRFTFRWTPPYGFLCNRQM